MPDYRFKTESAPLISRVRTDPRAQLAIIAVVSLQALMSIRVIFKYVDTLPLVAFVVFVGVVVAGCAGTLRSDRLLAFMTSPRTLALAVVSLLILVAIVYPKADALKESGRGSDRDDCVRTLVNNVFALRAPYGFGTFDDPCSTGPTEFLVFFPVQIWSAGYFILVPALSTLFGYWVLTQVVDRSMAVLLSLTQFTSLLFVQVSAVGTDLVVIGWLLAVATVASRKGLEAASTRFMIGGGVAYALFAGSRVPLTLVAVGSFGVLLLAFGSRAWRVVVPAALITAAAYLGTYLIAPSSFRPGHLVRKSGRIILDLGADNTVLVVVLVVILLGVFVAFMLRRPDLTALAQRHYSSVNLLLIVCPMTAVAIWDLRRHHFELGPWEGLHYLSLGLPLLLVMVGSWLQSTAVGRGAVAGGPST